jgi:hypothetical protein
MKAHPFGDKLSPSLWTVNLCCLTKKAKVAMMALQRRFDEKNIIRGVSGPGIFRFIIG